MKKTIYMAGLSLLAACGTKEKPADAFGNFEALETTISAEANGKVVFCNADEGDLVEANQLLAITDTVDFILRKAQLSSQQAAIEAKNEPLEAQKRVYQQQIENLTRDRDRFARMVKEGAATQKQLDDVEGAIKMAARQIDAITAQFTSLNSETAAISSQIEQANEAIRRCRLTAPVKGTILEAYVKQGEFVNAGKPMFKLADLSALDLRVYISGSQLATVKIGQQVKVYVDGLSDSANLTGVVTWVSSEAEFTPKTIQTREERVNLVYAIKVRVNNDGSLKIGMPGEVRL